MSEWAKGFWAMIAVCVTWGLSPIYYRALVGVPTVEVLAHRTIWSLALFLVVLGLQGRLGQLRAALTGRQAVRIALAALTVSANWGMFIWAVQAGHVVQSSLGYYIFPLAAVVTGVLVFGESLTWAQASAVLLAALAVGLLTWGLGVAPWISLGLATTFVLYGAVKKSLPLGPMLSVAAEVALLAPLALGWLFAQALGLTPAPLAFGANLPVSLLLVASGAITAVPLILFSYAARRVEMATLGLMFYVNPTLQFLCAVLIFDETFTGWHMVAFAMIWAALGVYSVSALRQSRRVAPLANG